MKPLLPLVVIAALAGCQKGTESATETGSTESPEVVEATAAATEIAPLVEGTQWVYDLETTVSNAKGTETGTGEFTIKVDKAETADGVVTASVSTLDPLVDPPAKSLMQWQLGPDGLVQMAGRNLQTKFDPPMPLVPATVTAGQKVSWTGTGVRLDGTVGKIDLAMTVIGMDELDTSMGRMNGWSVQSVAVWFEKDQQINARTTSWWSPKVGLVRMIREINAPEYGLKTVLRLKSHTVKQ